MPSWRLEPSAVKVARWVLRETALGNKCRPPDSATLAQSLLGGFMEEDSRQHTIG